MFKTISSALAMGALALLAVIPATASASGGGTGTPGVITLAVSPTVTVNDRLLLTASVVTSCPLLYQYPGGPVATAYFPDGALTVEQAAGKDVAHAYLFGWTTVCDGVSRSHTLTGLAGDHPFRPGSAIVQASAGQVCGWDPVSATWTCFRGAAIQTVTITQVH